MDGEHERENESNSHVQMMEPGKFSERDGHIYCKSCYNSLFRPKGYGFGGGADSYKYVTPPPTLPTPLLLQRLLSPWHDFLFLACLRRSFLHLQGNRSVGRRGRWVEPFLHRRPPSPQHQPPRERGTHRERQPPLISASREIRFVSPTTYCCCSCGKVLRQLRGEVGRGVEVLRGVWDKSVVASKIQ